MDRYYGIYLVACRPHTKEGKSINLLQHRHNVALEYSMLEKKSRDIFSKITQFCTTYTVSEVAILEIRHFQSPSPQPRHLQQNEILKNISMVTASQ